MPSRELRRPVRLQGIPEAIADPTHLEHERLLQLSGPFESDALDLADTNEVLDSIFRKRGRRVLIVRKALRTSALGRKLECVVLKIAFTGLRDRNRRLRIVLIDAVSDRTQRCTN